MNTLISIDMDDSFSRNITDILKIELALLCSRIQLYYLVQWRIWNDRDVQKIQEARKRIMSLFEIRNESRMSQATLALLHTYYLRLSKQYNHELALLEYILDKYPNLMFMSKQDMEKAVEEAKRRWKR